MTVARPIACNSLNRNNWLQNRLQIIHNNNEELTTVTTAAACAQKGWNHHPSIVISQSNNLTYNPLKVCHSTPECGSESTFCIKSRLNFRSCLLTSGRFIYTPRAQKRATDQPFHSSLTFASQGLETVTSLSPSNKYKSAPVNFGGMFDNSF